MTFSEIFTLGQFWSQIKLSKIFNQVTPLLVRFRPFVPALHCNVLEPVAVVHVHLLRHLGNWRRRHLDRAGQLPALAVDRRGLDEQKHRHFLVHVPVQLDHRHPLHLFRMGRGRVCRQYNEKSTFHWPFSPG